jgi:hypothetical protein
MADNVLAFPGKNANGSISGEADRVPAKQVLDGFAEKADDLQMVLVIGIKNDGQVCWGSSTSDLLEVLWASKAMERIAMDHSLGLIDDG